MRPTSSHLLLCLFLLFGLGLARPAQADITVAAKQLSLPGLRLQDLNARLGEDPAGGLHLQLQAAQADVAALGWRRVGLHLDGRLWRDAQLRWVFDGRVQLRGAPGGALGNAQLTWTVNPGSDTMQVELRQDKAQASAWLPLDQPSHAQISLRQLPAAWLQGLLGTVWSGRLTGGRLDADLALDAGDAGVQSSGQFALADVGFDTPGGTLAGQRVDGNGRFGFDSGDDGAQISLQGSLGGTESTAREQNMARVQLQAMESNATSTKTMYEAFVQRLRQSQNLDDVQTPESRIISEAAARTAKLPDPLRERTSPSARNRASASRILARESPNISTKSVSEGRRSPSCRPPMKATSWRYALSLRLSTSIILRHQYPLTGQLLSD